MSLQQWVKNVKSWPMTSVTTRLICNSRQPFLKLVTQSIYNRFKVYAREYNVTLCLILNSLIKNKTKPVFVIHSYGNFMEPDPFVSPIWNRYSKKQVLYLCSQIAPIRYLHPMRVLCAISTWPLSIPIFQKMVNYTRLSI